MKRIVMITETLGAVHTHTHTHTGSFRGCLVCVSLTRENKLNSKTKIIKTYEFYDVFENACGYARGFGYDCARGIFNDM